MTTTMTTTLVHDPSPGTATGRPAAVPVPMGSVQGALALDLRQSWEPPLLQEVPSTSGTDGLVAPRGQAGDVEGVARGFSAALVEVLSGDRGPAQLLRWTSPEVYDQLQERTALLARTVPGDRRVRRLRSRVRSVRVFRPRPAVAEISIHLRRGERSQAVAARLEHRTQRHRGRAAAAWVCVALEIG